GEYMMVKFLVFGCVCASICLGHICWCAWECNECVVCVCVCVCVSGLVCWIFKDLHELSRIFPLRALKVIKSVCSCVCCPRGHRILPVCVCVCVCVRVCADRDLHELSRMFPLRALKVIKSVCSCVCCPRGHRILPVCVCVCVCVRVC